MNNQINVVVTGATGKMGREIIKGLYQDKKINVVGAVDINHIGRDIGDLIGTTSIGVEVEKDLVNVIEHNKPDVLIDFTKSDSARDNVSIALRNGVAVVVGTTGLTDDDMMGFDTLAKKNKIGVFFAPNFSLGAVVMMKYAREISRFFDQAEIIEYHNDKKVDSPSGTALATAHALVEENGKERYENSGNDQKAFSRGLKCDGISVHSVRMKSLVAHQEVLFSGCGELLTIRHDSYSRESFLPGIKLAVTSVKNWQGLKRGLDSILE